MNFSERWPSFKQEIRQTLATEEFEGWLDSLQLLELSEESVVIGGIPHPIFRDDIKRNYDGLFRRIFNRLYPEYSPFQKIKISYCVGSQASLRERPQQSEFLFDEDSVSERLRSSGFREDSGKRSNILNFPYHFNPKFTLESFVVGNGNRLAYEAGVRIAQGLGTLYNPFYVYGELGLGKTHLIEGIGNMAQKLFPEIRLVYVTGEEFLNQFIQHIQKRQMHQFRERYRTADLLILDDVHVLASASSCQEELLHTISGLKQKRKQIIAVSHLLAGELPFDKALRSQLESGLTVALQRPDLETRMAILQTKALEDQIFLPPDVCGFIAQSIHSSVRKLEGALIRLGAHASLLKERISLEFAKGALADLLEVAPDLSEKEISDDMRVEEQIFELVYSSFQVSLADLQSGRREGQLVKARQMTIYLLKEFTSLSLNEIGRYLGNRSHSAVHYSLQQIMIRSKEDVILQHQVKSLTQKLRNQIYRVSEAPQHRTAID